MVSRLRRARALGLFLFASGFITLACEKVPLLAPTGSTITLTPSATTLPIGGTADIIAQVIRASGTPPHEGTHITFTTSLGSIQPSEADTDISGRAVVKYVANGGSGTATITALSGGVSVAAANVIKIQVGAAAVGSVSVQATPATLSSSGGTSTITATVSDTSGNPLPSVPVTFAIDTGTTGTAGGNGTLGQTVVITDANGRAQTTLTTTRTTTVSATAGVATTTGTTTTAAQVGRVTVTVNTTSSIAIGAPSPAAPVAGNAVTFPLTYGTSTTASPIVRLSVDWGDGQTQSYTGQPAAISHTFFSARSYLIVVTGVDAVGDPSTVSTSITVAPKPQPFLTITVSPVSPQAGQTVTFTANVTQSTTGNTTQSVQWDFGDGTQGTLAGNSTVISHVYNIPATYIVTAIATDSTGATASATTTVVVTPKPNPAVALGVSPNPSTLAQQPVTFTATVTQLSTFGTVTVDHYEWSFGDGSGRTTTSNITNHSYTLPTGLLTTTYTASVTAVMSDGTRSTSSIEVRVNAT